MFFFFSYLFIHFFIPIARNKNRCGISNYLCGYWNKYKKNIHGIFYSVCPWGKAEKNIKLLNIFLLKNRKHCLRFYYFFYKTSWITCVKPKGRDCSFLINRSNSLNFFCFLWNTAGYVSHLCVLKRSTTKKKIKSIWLFCNK